ncbi:hypothetical protein [Candidatus Cytomitobacter primus]|uniref:Uncharacterized protein n=1 Tax=Candidatus Cytomitobacter primus TaxID=2066024 RepID=A0A5C0UGF8_9PROT|nr:hypothetical protein [Candidatus Cytomitobacter primus]QEK38372.1 hypothetical protein FZC34_00330 [Candidatus Cytomitobacter primus]
MFLRGILLSFFVLSIGSDVAQEKNVAVVGTKTNKSVKINYKDIVSNLYKVFAMQGISPNQIAQLTQKNPQILQDLIAKIREQIIDEEVLFFMSKDKGYESNAAYIKRFADAKKAVSNQIYREERAKQIVPSDKDLKDKYDEVIGKIPNIKKYDGTMIVLKNKSDADGVLKIMNNRDKSKSIDDTFISLGNAHSITDFSESKGHFSMNEREIESVYGKNMMDNIQSTKAGNLTNVIKFDDKSKLEGKYAVVLVKKVSNEKKPEMESIKEQLKKAVIVGKIKEEINKHAKEIGVKKYNKDGLLEEEKPANIA